MVRYSLRNGPDLMVNHMYKIWNDVEISQRISNSDSWFLPIYYDELRINESLTQNPYYDYQ